MIMLHREAKDYALRIAGARAKYGSDDARTLAVIEEARAWMRRNVAFHTSAQRKWQSRVSRNPLRGNYHDSWYARERYVRCVNSIPYRDEIEGYAQAIYERAGRPKVWSRVTL